MYFTSKTTWVMDEKKKVRVLSWNNDATSD